MTVGRGMTVSRKRCVGGWIGREGGEGLGKACRRQGVAGNSRTGRRLRPAGTGLVAGRRGNQAEGAWNVRERRPEPLQEGLASLRCHACRGPPWRCHPRDRSPGGGASREPVGGRCRPLGDRGGLLRGLARGSLRNGSRGRAFGFDRRCFADEAGVVPGRRMGGNGGRFGRGHDPWFFRHDGFIDGDRVGAPGRKLHDGRARDPFPFDGVGIIEPRNQSLIRGEFLFRGDPDRSVGGLDPFREGPTACRRGCRARLPDDRVGLSTAGFEGTEGGQRRQQPDE